MHRDSAGQDGSRATSGTEFSTIGRLAGWLLRYRRRRGCLSIDHVVDHHRASYALGCAVRGDSCLLSNSGLSVRQLIRASRRWGRDRITRRYLSQIAAPLPKRSCWGSKSAKPVRARTPRARRHRGSRTAIHPRSTWWFRGALVGCERRRSSSTTFVALSPPASVWTAAHAELASRARWCTIKFQRLSGDRGGPRGRRSGRQRRHGRCAVLRFTTPGGLL